MSEESEKINFMVKKSLPLVSSQGIVSQAKINGELRPQRDDQE